MSKWTKATSISQKVRKIVNDRDRGCIFCQMGYRVPDTMRHEAGIMELMHFVGRGKGGMGIPENLAKGCRYHHRQFDNSANRAEMKESFEWYMKEMYPGWEKENVIYHKWERR